MVGNRAAGCNDNKKIILPLCRSTPSFCEIALQLSSKHRSHTVPLPTNISRPSGIKVFIQPIHSVLGRTDRVGKISNVDEALALWVGNLYHFLNFLKLHVCQVHHVLLEFWGGNLALPLLVKFLQLLFECLFRIGVS